MAAQIMKMFNDLVSIDQGVRTEASLALAATLVSSQSAFDGL